MRRSAAVRQVFVFAACAAALLASFEDEAISAVASGMADEISSRAPSDPADGFPDLFRDSISSDADAATHERAEPVAEAPRSPRRSDGSPRPPGRTVTVLFGVWRI